MALAAEPLPAPYPVRLWMDYPERLSRLSTFFRAFLALPILFFLYLLQGGIVAAVWAAILVRGRIPRWLFDYEVGVNRFTHRAFAYFVLLTDRYPAFEGDWVMDYAVDYPERVSRWRLALWKLITSIPHFVVLAFLSIAAGVVVIVAWFAILVTGAYPRGLHAFVVGVMRWWARATAYFTSLTDVFPPYSLDEDAGPGGAQTLSAVIGGTIVVAGVVGGIVIGIIVYQLLNETETRTVPYQAALAGELSGRDQEILIDDTVFTLEGGADPGDAGDLLRARDENRLVEFTVRYANTFNDFYAPIIDVERDTVRLKTTDGMALPVLLTRDGFPAPVEGLPQGAPSPTFVGTLHAIFEIDDNATVEELRVYPNARVGRRAVWKFE